MPPNSPLLPENLRVVVFVDGQNLYYGARSAWREDDPRQHSPYSWPSYDVQKIAMTLAGRKQDRCLVGTRFYTGVPSGKQSTFWNQFWSKKLFWLETNGIYTYRGRISHSGNEKGVDVSLSINLIKLTYERAYDIAVIVSQDWDFGPAVKLAREIAAGQGRRIRVESAFCENRRNNRGIPGTDWVVIDQGTYDSCRDVREYRTGPP